MKHQKNSLIQLDSPCLQGNRITLARRHLSPSDPRACWNTHTIREQVIKNIYNDYEDDVVMPPWHCASLNA